MSDKPLTFNNIAPLRNVTAMLELAYQVRDREYGLPGFGMLYGWAGFGKSIAATYAAIKTDAVLIQANRFMRPKSLCETLCTELGLVPERAIDKMIKQIAQAFSENGRPLIIDEADHLIMRDMLELVRVIYESSEIGIILVGEELFPQNVRKWERVDSRMLSRVAAQPADLGDLNALAKIYCKGIDLDDEFKAYLLKTARYSHRRITTALSNVRSFGRTRGISAIDRELWGTRTFDNGDAPAPRKAVA
jgi:DNA transposition AAA+ family ATPase